MFYFVAMFMIPGMMYASLSLIIFTVVAYFLAFYSYSPTLYLLIECFLVLVAAAAVVLKLFNLLRILKAAYDRLRTHGMMVNKVQTASAANFE